ncbi:MULTISPECIES: acyl carrier protein [Streptomyces]|uniref:acyl carrier protein n=1 Tax=Streptomyces TaxID=1883 RepID=UPI0037AEDFC4
MALILRLDQVAEEDRFFELGGHSLSVIRLITALSEPFGIEVPLPELFDDPTRLGVGGYVEGRLSEQGSLRRQTRNGGSCPTEGRRRPPATRSSSSAFSAPGPRPLLI